MNVKLFKDRAEKYAKRTKNVRIYSQLHDSLKSVELIPDKFTLKFPSIIAFIQEQSSNLCGTGQYLLVYNFQIYFKEDAKDIYYCNLDMLIKPMKDIEKTHEQTGQPLSLVVNCKTGEVCNAAKGAFEVANYMMVAETENDTEEHISYGYYTDIKYAFDDEKEKETQTPLDTKTLSEDSALSLKRQSCVVVNQLEKVTEADADPDVDADALLYSYPPEPKLSYSLQDPSLAQHVVLKVC